MATSGSIALRNTWRLMTSRSGPFARAVRTKSSFIVSSTLARTIRT